MNSERLIRSLREGVSKRDFPSTVDTHKGKGPHSIVEVGSERTTLQSDLNPGRTKRALKQPKIDPNALQTVSPLCVLRHRTMGRAAGMDWVFGTAVRQDGADYVVSVRDLPEVVTGGDDEAHALAQAVDAIEVSIGFRMEKGEPLPMPSPVLDGEHAVALSALSAVKASLYTA